MLPFCLALFRTLESQPLVAGTLLFTYLLARQRLPTSALPAVLVVTVVVVFIRGGVKTVAGPYFGRLNAPLPVFNLRAVFGLGLPLFLVTLAP